MKLEENPSSSADTQMFPRNQFCETYTSLAFRTMTEDNRDKGQGQLLLVWFAVLYFFLIHLIGLSPHLERNLIEIKRPSANFISLFNF